MDPRANYWLHWHNVRYEIDKRIEKWLLVIAMRLPARLRMWVVVDATNTARQLYPHPTGYAGPDGLGYSEIYDGALKRRGETDRVTATPRDGVGCIAGTKPRPPT